MNMEVMEFSDDENALEVLSCSDFDEQPQIKKKQKISSKKFWSAPPCLPDFITNCEELKRLIGERIRHLPKKREHKGSINEAEEISAAWRIIVDQNVPGYKAARVCANKAAEHNLLAQLNNFRVAPHLPPVANLGFFGYGHLRSMSVSTIANPQGEAVQITEKAAVGEEAPIGVVEGKPQRKRPVATSSPTVKETNNAIDNDASNPTQRKIHERNRKRAEERKAEFLKHIQAGATKITPSSSTDSVNFAVSYSDLSSLMIPNNLCTTSLPQPFYGAQAIFNQPQNQVVTSAWNHNLNSAFFSYSPSYFTNAVMHQASFNNNQL